MVDKNLHAGRQKHGSTASSSSSRRGGRLPQAHGEVSEGGPRVVFRADRVERAIADGKRVTAQVEAWSPQEARDGLPDISLLEAKFIEVYFFCPESIAAAKILRTAQLMWRRDLENMDDAETRNAIASLMARVGELQASGALEAVPSDRLARVAKLIGEATEILSADPQTYVPLFRDREADPQTGKKPTALQWFDNMWKPRVDAGEATGDDIRQADFKFYEALASYQKSKGRKLSDLLPPSPTRGRLAEDERSARRKAAARERMRKLRASGSTVPK